MIKMRVSRRKMPYNEVGSCPLSIFLFAYYLKLCLGGMSYIDAFQNAIGATFKEPNWQT